MPATIGKELNIKYTLRGSSCLLSRFGEGFSLRNVFGIVLLVVGLFSSFLVNYFTSVPFVVASAVVESAEYRLSPKHSTLEVNYKYTVRGIEYEGQTHVPVVLHRKFEVGSTIKVSYSMFDPSLVTIGDPPSPSPIFLFTGAMALWGILLAFGNQSLSKDDTLLVVPSKVCFKVNNLV